jgi:hypothetical protein
MSEQANARIYRPGTNGFTQIWNAVIVDHRLGATAFRVASYLGSKTDDWTIRERNVCRTLSIGKAAYRAAMRELHAAGYITRGKTERDASGHLRSAPSQLRRGLIVADPARAQVGPKTGYWTSGSPNVGAPDIGPSDNLLNTLDSTLSTQQEEGSSNGHALTRASLPVADGNRAKAEGLRVSACRTCADVLSSADLLSDLRSMGQDLAAFHAFHTSEDSK